VIAGAPGDARRDAGRGAAGGTVTPLARERLGGAVEVLRLDRPDRRNAMNTALLDALLAALGELREDADLGALVFSTTNPTALTAGADSAEPRDAAAGRLRMERCTQLYAAVEAVPAPTICVCVGNCVGAGAELAAGCDLRVGGDNLKLAWAGARHGVPVGPARLVPLVGMARAKDLILTGRVVGADEAPRWPRRARSNWPPRWPTATPAACAR
jgi:enoyl-CoA hydratase/carnithine racemase